MKEKISLWQNGTFNKLWLSQILTQVGAEVSLFALPIFAIMQLHITPIQMGYLVFSEQLAPIVLGIFSGILIDRHNPLKIMIASEVFRALILLFIFMSFYFSHANFYTLAISAFLLGTGKLFFDVSYRKLIPALFHPSEIIQCNAKLASANSLSELLGPVIAGCVIKFFSAADALFFNIIFFIFSSLFLLPLKKLKINLAIDNDKRKGGISSVYAGYQFVFKMPLLRVITLSGAIWNFCYALIYTIFIFYAVNQLKISPLMLSLVFIPGALGVLVGASIIPLMIKKFGYGKSLLFGVGLTVVWGAILSLLQPVESAVFAIGIAFFFFGLGQTIFNVINVSINQIIIPPHLIGKVIASLKVLFCITVPLGALASGYLAEARSPREAIFIATLGLMFSAFILALPQVRQFKLEASEHHTQSGLG
uniref:MFS transporter n=1 Tax=Serratia quinivorans TaxID=137545 RepID=UPI0035C6E598